MTSFVFAVSWRRFKFPSSLLYLGLCCCVQIVLAQSTGGIQGTVSDASGGAVANASITITNTATDQSQTFKTDSDGLYAASSLQPGSYRIEVKAPGLQTTVANNLTVAVGTTTRQDFTLQVASTTQTVEIQAAPPVVETSSVSLGSVVNQRTVQEIPLNGRHFVDLAQLIPGTVTPPQSGFLTSPLRGQGTSSFNSSGAREDTVNFMINGVNMNDIAQNQITFQPTVNTVEEFKIDNSTFSAEYGRNSGSIVNIATRPGTNAVHGEAYDYLRNNYFDARNFSNPVGIPQSPFKRNQFGGDVGLPIHKDTTFLFLSYEQLKQRQSVPLSTPVLSSAQRALAAASPSAVVRDLLSFIPAANQTGNVFAGNAIAPVDIWQGTANFTQSFGQSNRLNAFYAMQQDQRNEPPTTQGNNLPGFGDSRHGVRQLLTLNETTTISPTLVNEARAGFNRIHIVFAAANTLNAADYGINSGVNAPIGLPQISVNGAFAFGGINGFPQGRGDDTIVLSDTLELDPRQSQSQVRGRVQAGHCRQLHANAGHFQFPEHLQFHSGPGKFVFGKQLEPGIAYLSSGSRRIRPGCVSGDAQLDADAGSTLRLERHAHGSAQSVCGFRSDNSLSCVRGAEWRAELRFQSECVELRTACGLCL